MRTGSPAILIHTPTAAGLGNRGVPGTGQGSSGGRHVGAEPAPAVRDAALPRPGVSSSTPAAACCTAAPKTALAPGGGPPIALSATSVPAGPRSGLGPPPPPPPPPRNPRARGVAAPPLR